MQQPQISIETELRKSYLEYSLSVIIGRAIPDARDGLKPVHRRILFAQYELANNYNRPHKKSARIVGDVIGKYHPHGDSAVYDALVRMAQEFSMRDPLVDGQGNFGSIDGDAAAAMRYTEVRMSKLAQEFLNDLDKNTVDFRPNYDNTLQEPTVMPSKVPNLLLNGSSGIAVGMATNIPPHNLGELCDALQLLLDNPQCSIDELMDYVKGPDFPTRGFVYAGKGLYDAYHTGRGTVKVRGRIEIEDRKKGAQSIVIREIPFGLNKSSLVEKIAALVNDRKIDGITDLRDESDRKGIRIVIDLKRGTIPDIVVNALYKFTPLETSFGINMLAVVDNRPQLLNLKTALSCFVDHRREVVIRRTRYDLEKAEARAHILEGLRIAIDNIDEVVALIRASANPEEARNALMERFALSEVQAKAILEMRLQRLTGLQREELMNEYKDLLQKIEFYRSILENAEVLRSELKREIAEIRDNFATPRRTEVLREALTDIDIEDLIPDEEVVITLSRRGYMKRTGLENYQQQKRGGKGIAALHTSDDDYVQEFLSTTNHQYLCLFTNKGRMHQLKVHQVPEGSRTAKGVHINNLLPLEENEWVTTVLALREFAEDKFFLFITKRGMIKRSSASLYAKCRKTGLMAVGLREDDELVVVRPIRDNNHIVLATADGFSIRFACNDVRPMGRVATGVKGIALRRQDFVVAAVIVKDIDQTTEIMSISANGYGKRTSVDLYRLQSRGGKGIINFKVTAKTGPVIGAMPVRDNDGLILLTSSNKIVRIGVDDVRSKGRATMGVMLVRLDEGGHVVGFDRVDEGGQTGRDASAEMDDDDLTDVASATVVAESEGLADDSADDDGEE
ncbi:DNA gyrase subunit A [Desulfovibrio desulfuricans]|nr:DNA gyrase subunit A [Desulfovibrio desulfuricans]MBD8896431.1 DNA gyrase subunit A [Desulfovibrio desulfuricans]MBT9748790.1 DNA gyrase subunit A [Desulfovibrio desulfuricans]MCB6541440.1 DNA gyrase subunit A [Desulfovibrio desulfuricans]MCB6552522.1 DNA gyrase subunit A [Desulfovibrio desulfuricans]MCB6564230.1 DNA gyrase subunit A [Desulfovibrio desulfuricans]